VVGGVHVCDWLTKGGAWKLAVSILVTEYKSITEVNGFYARSKWNKTSCKYGCGNGIAEARNAMGNKKHEVLIVGELFHKSLTHLFSCF
jgi:hypothetical protein